MDNEIDLREIFQVLWRGKYLILGITALLLLSVLFYLLFIVTPSFQYSAFLDLQTFGVKAKEALSLIEQDDVIEEAVAGLTDDPGELARTAKVNTVDDNESILEIKVEYAEPDVCLNSVKQIGVAILEAVSEYRKDQIVIEKERSERLLVYLDEAVEEYLQSRDKQIMELLEDDPVYRRLLEEKAASLVKLKLNDFNLNELAETPVLDAETWINSQEGVARPVTINKKFYFAAALFLGLALSIFILFIHHYFTQVYSNSTEEPD